MHNDKAIAGKMLFSRTTGTRRDLQYDPVKPKKADLESKAGKARKAYLAGLKASLDIANNRSEPFYKDEELNQAWLQGNADGRKMKENGTVNFQDLLNEERELLKTNTRSK